MIDRLVCADGGIADPTSTSGKKVGKAKELEVAGWDYPQHLVGRAYGLIVHGDVAGVEDSRRALSDWLDWMVFIDAGAPARLDRYIGYYQPYATSHDALDRDEPVQEEARSGQGGGRVACRPPSGGAAEFVTTAAKVSSLGNGASACMARFPGRHPAVALAAHRRFHLVACEFILKFMAAILAAPV